MKLYALSLFICALLSLVLITVCTSESKLYNTIGTMKAAKELANLRLQLRDSSTLTRDDEDGSGDVEGQAEVDTELKSEEKESKEKEETNVSEDKPEKEEKGETEEETEEDEWSDKFETPAEAGQFVPFGKKVPRKEGVRYYVTTGKQECAVCRKIIANSYLAGVNFYNLCGGLYPEHNAMCHTQQVALQQCQEFQNDWCYKDLGGNQELVAPCPDHLKCHYCLGLNPLNCVDE